MCIKAHSAALVCLDVYSDPTDERRAFVTRCEHGMVRDADMSTCVVMSANLYQSNAIGAGGYTPVTNTLYINRKSCQYLLYVLITSNNYCILPYSVEEKQLSVG